MSSAMHTASTGTELSMACDYRYQVAWTKSLLRIEQVRGASDESRLHRTLCIPTRFTAITNTTRNILAVISISGPHAYSLTFYVTERTTPQPHGCLAPGFPSVPQDAVLGMICTEDHGEGVLAS
jgi:hypothetical protein